MQKHGEENEVGELDLDGVSPPEWAGYVEIVKQLALG